jgi:hypothetical protein
MNEFILLVAEMRRLQIQYFTKGRDKYVLMDSKKAESDVDEWLLNNGYSDQPVKKSVADAKQGDLLFQ